MRVVVEHPPCNRRERATVHSFQSVFLRRHGQTGVHHVRSLTVLCSANYAHSQPLWRDEVVGCVWGGGGAGEREEWMGRAWAVGEWGG